MAERFQIERVNFRDGAYGWQADAGSQAAKSLVVKEGLLTMELVPDLRCIRVKAKLRTEGWKDYLVPFEAVTQIHLIEEAPALKRVVGR